MSAEQGGGTMKSDLREALSWALDLMDMYDARLAKIDGAEKVYTEMHLRGKAKARAALTGHDVDLREAVRAFVEAYGHNGSKTGREDYSRMIPLSDIEPLRKALAEDTP